MRQPQVCNDSLQPKLFTTRKVSWYGLLAAGVARECSEWHGAKPYTWRLNDGATCHKYGTHFDRVESWDRKGYTTGLIERKENLTLTPKAKARCITNPIPFELHPGDTYSICMWESINPDIVPRMTWEYVRAGERDRGGNM